MSDEAGIEVSLPEQIHAPPPAPQEDNFAAPTIKSDNSAQEAKDNSKLPDVRGDLAGFQAIGSGTSPEKDKVKLRDKSTSPSNLTNSDQSQIINSEIKTESVTSSSEQDSYIAELDTLSKHERAEIFGSAVSAMYEIAQEHGITLPENLIGKIHVVGEKDFYKIIEKETDQVIYPEEWDVHGISLHKIGVALLNAESLSRISKLTGITEKEIVRTVGIHELWHTSDKNGLLAFSSYTGTPLEGQAEEAGLPVHSTWFPEGIWGVTEGFTEYRTREVMKRAGLPFRYSEYLGETEIIDKLSEKIGIEPFYRLHADNGVEGMVSFSRSLDAAFGDEALKRLMYRISWDYQTHGAPGHGEKRDFSGTESYFINLDQILAKAT